MQIINKNINEIKPYERNPRKNDEAVKYVAESIKQFGFKVPIIIDKDGIIVAGHTRYKASKELKLEEIPCVIADDLSDEQIKAYRLADNKVNEKSEWDFELLTNELEDICNIDMTNFGFENFDINWDDVEDLTASNYDRPEHNMLECPSCHHIDRDIHFKKVKEADVINEMSDEE